MMTHTNMKQIGWLLCLAVLLAGCGDTPKSPKYPVSFGGIFGESRENQFIVEGNAYKYVCVYGLAKDDCLIYSLTLVFPQCQHYYPVTRYVDGEIKGQIYAQDTRTTIFQESYHDRVELGDGSRKVADIPFHYIYFIDNERIVFQKSNEELGIDASDFRKTFTNRKLRPILETLIREHVQPQEPEMEEETTALEGQDT